MSSVPGSVQRQAAFCVDGAVCGIAAAQMVLRLSGKGQVARQAKVNLNPAGEQKEGSIC